MTRYIALSQGFKAIVERLAQAEATIERLKSRSCDTCGRPCDTVDESNYQGDEPFYCARWTERGGE